MWREFQFEGVGLLPQQVFCQLSLATALSCVLPPSCLGNVFVKPPVMQQLPFPQGQKCWRAQTKRKYSQYTRVSLLVSASEPRAASQALAAVVGGQALGMVWKAV